MTTLSTLLVMLAVATSARAVDLGDGLTVTRTPGDYLVQVFASQGDVKVELKPKGNTSGHVVVGARITKSPDGVSVTFRMDCNYNLKETYSRSNLLSMIDHRRGLDLVTKGSPAAAAPLLERALASQPDEARIRVDLVVALVAMGRRDDAVTVLAATAPRTQLVVTWLVSKDPSIAWLADEPPLRGWRVRTKLTSPPAWDETGRFLTKPFSLPAWDPTRRLVVVSYWNGSIGYEGWKQGTAVLDADTGALVYRTRGHELALLAAELGFEESIELHLPNPTKKVHLETGGISFVGNHGRLYAKRKVIGRSRYPWSYANDAPETGVALFDDRAIITGNLDDNVACGATGSDYAVFPITRPPAELATMAQVNRARRELIAGRNEAALALGGDEPLVKAWRAIALARAGDLAKAQATLATLPEVWALVAATHPLAPASLKVNLPQPSGDATSLPAWDATRRVLALPHATRPNATVFVDAHGSTTIAGMEVTPEFLSRRGFTKPLGMTKAHPAAQGDWRAVYAGPPELRISCADDKLAFVRAGRFIGGSTCDGRHGPGEVWFFPEAVVYRGLKEMAWEDQTYGAPVVRFVIAEP